MTAGELDRRITIQTAQKTANALNEPIETWVMLATVRAKKTDVSDGERIRAAGVSAEITTRFLIRWSQAVSVVTANDRVLFAGRAYDIFAVKEVGRREAIEITAAARADQ